MAVFRVEKNENYTVMANYHLRDRKLSLKAKGLLSLMLSLPDDWDYTTRGLAEICKDGVDGIRATVQELENAGYLHRARLRDGHGRLAEIEYTILEKPESVEESPKRENPVQVESPKRDFPILAKPVQEKPVQENPTQLNTKVLNTKLLNSHDGGDAGEAENAEAEEAPSQEEADAEQTVRDIAVGIFEKYGNGKRASPFDMDATRSALQTEDGIDLGRRELLEYAFEQAALNGHRGVWSYALGVLRNLDERGIRTAAEARAYKPKREPAKRPEARRSGAIYGSGELGTAELEAIHRVLQDEPGRPWAESGQYADAGCL